MTYYLWVNVPYEGYYLHGEYRTKRELKDAILENNIFLSDSKIIRGKEIDLKANHKEDGSDE